MAYSFYGDTVCIGNEDDLKKEEYKDFVNIEEGELKDKKGEIQRVEILHKDEEKEKFDSLFENCDQLASVSVGPNIKLGEKMFSGCSKLKWAFIDNGCTLEKEIFKGCKNLFSFNCGKSQNEVKIEKEAFKDAKIVNFDVAGITDIGESAFENCEFGKELSMIKLKNIGSNAFKGSRNAKIILDINNLQFVGEGAFDDAEGLEFKFLGSSDINELGNDFFINVQELLNYPEFIKKLKPKGLDVSTMRKINRKSFRDMLRRVGFLDGSTLHKVVDAIGNQQGAR